MQNFSYQCWSRANMYQPSLSSRWLSESGAIFTNVFHFSVF
jgi:hypothetical protein